MNDTIKKISFIFTFSMVSFFFSSQVWAEKFTLKIASGHSPSWHFIQLTQNYFMPEVKKRVKEKTGHDIDRRLFRLDG